MLQKMVYCAHGWWLAFTKEPLVSEEPEVWDLGPVFSSLYHQRKGLKPVDVIPEENNTKNRKEITDEKITEFLDQVYNRYNRYCATQMIALTHADGTPWHQIITPYRSEKSDLEVPRNLPIPNKLIQSHFEMILAESKPSR